MSTPPRAVTTIQALIHSHPGKRVLVVEGVNDKAVYTVWLRKLAHPDPFSSKVVIESVGNKQSVLTVLAWYRDHGGNPSHLFGLVDRDEWDGPTIATRAAELPQLRVVPGRDGLESYFTDPDELEPSLGAEDPAYVPHLAPFRAHLEAALSAWVDHWALFMTTERVKERMNAAIYPGAFHATIPIPPDPDIQARFQAWAALVAHPNLFNEFDALRTQARTAAQGQRFRSHVSAKRFFEEVVYPGPNGLQRFRGKPERTWRIDLAESTPTVPPDIAAILQLLLL